MPLIRSAIAGLKLNGVRKLKVRALLVAGALIISYGSFWSFQEKFATWNSRVVDHLVRLQPRFTPAPASGEPAVILVDPVSAFGALLTSKACDTSIGTWSNK